MKMLYELDAFILLFAGKLNYFPDKCKSNSDIAKWQRDRLDETLNSEMRFNCQLIVPVRKETM
jgi:hypothetical protein